MSNFKYKLDPGPAKHFCPNCGKRRLVRYIDRTTGEYVEDAGLGRCDRESACGYHKAPSLGKKCYLVECMAIRSISEKAYKITDKLGVFALVPKSQVLERLGSGHCYITEWFLEQTRLFYNKSDVKYFSQKGKAVEMFKPLKPAIEKKPSFHSLELVQDYFLDQRNKDNLTIFLESKFPKGRVETVCREYLLSVTNSYWPASTVFWQIDEAERVHAGKIMNYDPITGKRIKEPFPRINWIHNAIKAKDFKLNQCLFGQHLLATDYDSTIGIVESEKTALIMAILEPSILWLATGSKQNLKPSMLKPLKNRDVVLFPDKSEFQTWKEKAQGMGEVGMTSIAVSTKLENNNDLPEGADLADLYLKTL
ncbi:DUF6371 domain-containing protein [Maribacter polysaccharolyticus]|uniref:DUF6371 domain-containing protein n=1 Tax=Maribacter polysaccharolyticus TaxID=3020831 RepID=UPI00237FC04D|nr:DUF6371 domain-containing protein [Maribacter polysaccharolyticus]MDE3741670.1 DUF6371 domain-containing protein [Maribacter polysaccharolyticus]